MRKTEAFEKHFVHIFALDKASICSETLFLFFKIVVQSLNRLYKHPGEKYESLMIYQAIPTATLCEFFLCENEFHFKYVGNKEVQTL